MELHPSVTDRLARLAPDQRAAATAPPGPSLCIAPAGSGKTTTLVARASWLIATGTPADAIRAITFNKRAAVEMTERLDAAVAPLGIAPGVVRVRNLPRPRPRDPARRGFRGRAAGRPAGHPR
jgi:superfamily I DNA/RNA helicase